MDWKEDMEPEEEAMNVLDQFTSSDIYRQIAINAENGDEDSTQVLEDLSAHLGSLCFHLNNKTGDARIRYDLGELKQFVEQWYE